MQHVVQAQEISRAKAPLNLRGILWVFLDSALPSSGNAEYFLRNKKR